MSPSENGGNPMNPGAGSSAGRFLVAVSSASFLVLVGSLHRVSTPSGLPESSPTARAASRSSAVLDGLKWLARHQAKDGSWGRRLALCACPQSNPIVVPPVRVRDAEVEKKARPLIEALDREDPKEREESSAALKALGEKVEPFLEDACLSKVAEIRGRAADLLAELRWLREPAPPVGITAWALDAFLGAGYSQLSRDVYDDLDFGVVCKKAIQWLIARQNEDGSIGDGERSDATVQHSWATFALSEAYGMTAAAALKEPAQKAVTFLLTRQSADGGWNPKGPSLDAELLASVFAGLALKSAELSELEMDAGRFAKARRYFDSLLGQDGLSGASPARAGVGGVMTILLLFDRKKALGDERMTKAAEWLNGSKPKKSEPDFLGWHFASSALYQFSAPEGPFWKGWNESMKQAIIPRQESRGCVDGSWSPEGDLAAMGGLRFSSTAIAVLTLEVYYRYANLFGR